MIRQKLNKSFLKLSRLILPAFLFFLIFIGSAISAQAFCAKLDPNPKTITLKPGESANITISISTLVNINYGTEVFNITGLPSNTNASFSPSTIPYNNGYQGTAHLTIKTSPTTPEGSYSITIHLIGSGPDSFPGNTATVTLIISKTTTISTTTTTTITTASLISNTWTILGIIILLIIIGAIIIILRRR